MTTIRRTIVILIILAVIFFIYRGINPQGADRLIAQVRTIPDRFLWTGNAISLLLTQEETSLSGSLSHSGSVLSWHIPQVVSWAHLSGALGSGIVKKIALQQKTGTVLTGKTLTWKSLLGPYLSAGVARPFTGGKLTIISASIATGTVKPNPSVPSQTTGQKQTASVLSPWHVSAKVSPPKVVSVKPKTVSAPAVVASSSSHLSQQELRDASRLIDALFH